VQTVTWSSLTEAALSEVGEVVPADDAVRVFVVDDHDLFRGGAVKLLREQGIAVVGEADSGERAVALVPRLAPDVVLMDLNLPGMSGVETTRVLSEIAPRSRIVVLTVLAADEDVLDALLAGACGYLLKDATIEQIVDGVEAATRGESLISTRVAGTLVRGVRQPTPAHDDAQLTAREIQVLDLVAQGFDNRRIAGSLYISQHTVKNHIASILRKLAVENRIQAAVRAVRGGIF
jgi:two-component system, NarL family, nitrate/nitrite response regulator NarL